MISPNLRRYKFPTENTKVPGLQKVDQITYSTRNPTHRSMPTWSMYLILQDPRRRILRKRGRGVIHRMKVRIRNSDDTRLGEVPIPRQQMMAGQKGWHHSLIWKTFHRHVGTHWTRRRLNYFRLRGYCDWAYNIGYMVVLRDKIGLFSLTYLYILILYQQGMADMIGDAISTR